MNMNMNITLARDIIIRKSVKAEVDEVSKALDEIKELSAWGDISGTN